MADNMKSIDDLILCLVGMGFEFEDCQEAVQAGKLAVQEAVDWILSGKPKATSSSGQSGTLRLTGQLAESIGSNPFSAPPAPVVPAPPPAALGPSTDQDPDADNVVSRSHLNEEQRRIKDRFEEKQRQEARRKAQEDKMATKRARELALKQIQEDRERQKLRKQSKDTAVGACGASVSQQPAGGATGVSETATAATAKPEQRKCNIQIRLPTGRVLKESFPPSALLRDVWSLVNQHIKQLDDMCLMQPFPRKEFSSTDMDVSLSDHGLVPSGSLVLKKVDKPATAQADTSDSTTASSSTGTQKTDDPSAESSTSSVSMETEGGAIGGGLPLADSLGLEEDGSPVKEAAPSFPRGFHNWGHGQTLEGEGESPGEERLREVESSSDQDSDEDMDVAGGIVGQQPPQPWLGGFHQDQGAFQGFGQVLNAQFAGEAQQPHHHKDPKQLAAEAAAQREVLQPERTSSAPSLSSTPSPAHHTIPRLTHLMVQHISGRICDTRNPVTSLQGLPPEVATYILQYLISERLLRVKTLQPFINCHLRKLILDSYPYVTNELLTGIRLHGSLVHLSLANCPLITDKGILVLYSLKKLKFLSLLGCRQLTDGCFALFKDMPSIVTLVLEDTGITDKGIEEYCSSQRGPTNLQHLDLGRTQVTHSILHALKRVPKLCSLSLENTAILSLSGVESLSSLETLNVANTTIVPDSLLCLKGHPALRRLNISNTTCIQGDQALQYLQGLPLRNLQMPSRLTTTAHGVQCLTGMPLVELDLTNYINISPEGFEPVGSIHSLKRLRLGNTKITDAGMLFLTNLRQLEELFLDRTTITDTGAAVISGQNFPNLVEISISETLITNKLLCSGTLNSCTQLSKLNLSRTRISDSGAICLSLPYLVLLNLDSTCLSQDMVDKLLDDRPAAVLTGCTRLSRISCKNCSPEEMEEIG